MRRVVVLFAAWSTGWWSFGAAQAQPAAGEATAEVSGEAAVAPAGAAEAPVADGDAVVDAASPVVVTPRSRAVAGPVEVAAAGHQRPQGMTLGFGLGYMFPADLMEPNVAGVRIRFPCGIILEPLVEIEYHGDSFDTGFDEGTDDLFTVRLVAQARKPVARRGSFDLVSLAGIGIGYQHDNPDGIDNASTDTMVGLHWGLAIDYWLTRHWAVSVTATNPLLAYVRTTEEGFGGDETSESTTDVGLTFDPTITAMVHLFY